MAHRSREGCEIGAAVRGGDEQEIVPVGVRFADTDYVVYRRINEGNITYDTLAGQLIKIDLESGKILGALSRPVT